MATSTSKLAAPSLTVSFVWVLAGSIANAGSQWALIVLFAKLGTAALVGEYAFAAAVAYPISLLANLQLRTVFVADMEGRYPFKQMLGLRYLLAGSAWTVLLLICMVSRSARSTTVLVLLLGTALLIDTLSEAFYGLLQKYDRMDRIARSQMARSCLSLAMSASLLYFTHSLVYAVCGILIARLLVLMIYDAGVETFRTVEINSEGREVFSALRSFWDRFRPHWNFESQSQMVWVALPIGIVSVVLAYSSNIPRYIIEHYLGAHDLGIFSALNYIPQAAIMIALTLGNVTYARLSRLYFAGDIRGFRLFLGKNALICAASGALCLLVCGIAGPSILRILYRPEYAAHSDLLMWLVAAGSASCLASCVGWGMCGASQFRPQLPLFLVVCSVSAGSSFLLVPRLGLKGAAIANLAAMTTQILGASYILHRALKSRMAEAPRGNTCPVGANPLASES
jgi:O-antigen/teichoic acid export membrane protein